MQVLAHPPGPEPDEWDAVSEATLWCPDGRITVCGLMGSCPDPFRDIPVGRPGLLRVRVRARDRRGEHLPPTPEPPRPERHEVLVWPVDEDTGHATLRQDGPSRSEVKFGRAATWALLRLAALANPDPHELKLRGARLTGASSVLDLHGGGSATATIRRLSRTMPASTATAVLRDPALRLGLTVDGDALVLPVGDLAVRLIPDRPRDPSAFKAQWRWEVASAATGVNVPESRPSRVEMRTVSDSGTARLSVAHSEVAAAQAVPLGLLWDYLLDRAADGPAGPHPWVEVFEKMAADTAARVEAARRSRERSEARLWGGKPPSDRLRRLAANTIMLSNMDRPLLDALAEAAPEQQRAIANWAAQRACTVAGLAGIDWIAAALTALHRGEPLPPPFDDVERAWQRLWSDRRIPQTAVTTPDGTPNFSQQALAFQAFTQATNDDPLAAAVDALAAAMSAHGPAYREVATQCRATFPMLGRPDRDSGGDSGGDSGSGGPAQTAPDP